jgi:Ca-activated chloride channel family protein
MIHFAYPQVWYYAVPALFTLFIVRRYWRRPIVYRYSLGSYASKRVVPKKRYVSYLVSFLRATMLGILVFLLAKPQLVDPQTTVPVEGIDIMMVLDVSGSMSAVDYEDESRTRCDIAKREAIRFIGKRNDDALGLVIFGKEVVSRCPLTFDKKLLQRIVGDLEIGIVNPDGTMLSRAIIAGANRLKNSQAKSKIMIVLTDGTPSEGDLEPTVAIEVAKKMNIKMYTVGIGSDQDDVVMHPFYGLIQKPRVNTQLLTTMAQQTGGQFFMAHNADDMRRIYDTIDTLEKTKQDAPLFTKTYDWFVPWISASLVLLTIEYLCSTCVWFVL